jgi:hypothetical protein
VRYVFALAKRGLPRQSRKENNWRKWSAPRVTLSPLNKSWPPILKNVTPSFCEIANRPDTTTRSLARSVTHTHWDEESSPYKMPDPMLNPDQTRAVSQYILTLRGKCDFANARP